MLIYKAYILVYANQALPLAEPKCQALLKAATLSLPSSAELKPFRAPIKSKNIIETIRKEGL